MQFVFSLNGKMSQKNVFSFLIKCSSACDTAVKSQTEMNGSVLPGNVCLEKDGVEKYIKGVK